MPLAYQWNYWLNNGTNYTIGRANGAIDITIGTNGMTNGTIGKTLNDIVIPLAPMGNPEHTPGYETLIWRNRLSTPISIRLSRVFLYGIYVGQPFPCSSNYFYDSLRSGRSSFDVDVSVTQYSPSA